MEHLLKSLAEQLHISTREIVKRKELLGFTSSDEQVLKKHKALFARYLDGIVKNFYDQQITFPEIALKIGDAETLRRLQSAMCRYILELFDGVYDIEYVNRRLRIGKVHQRIGVSSKLYLSAIHLLQEVLTQTIDMHFLGKKEINKEALLLKRAINKVLMFDTQLVLDTYIASLVSEVETAKQELRDYANVLEDEVAQRTQQLHELSMRDMLTGVYNQRAFYDHLRRELAAAERYQEQLALIYFDLNGFKKLNDSKGHVSGDDVLTLVGESMLTAVRETDIPCRYGGDEFALILPRSTIDDAALVTGRLIDIFKEKNKEKVSFSVGLAVTGPEEFMDSDTFIKQADTRMYKSKAKSKRKAGFYITAE